jgi:shikimate dehydrogenase
MAEPGFVATSATKLYGILGHPVRHSLSPVLHNALFRKLGINAVYLAFDVAPDSLALAFEGLRALGVSGVNVTIPFKEEAVRYLDEIPEDVDRGMGAVNTVVNRDGRLYGYNTDAPGLILALREDLGFAAGGKRVLVLGAGGAARGAVFALAHQGAEAVYIRNRTGERAEGLAEYAAGHFPDTELRTLADDELKKTSIDLVVNATSLGMKPGDASPFDLKTLPRPAAVYDLVYSSDTALLREARSLGFKSANGLGMLAAQAAISFQLWTGKTEGVRETMIEALRKC